LVTDPHLSAVDHEVLGRDCAVVRLVPNAAWDKLVRLTEEFGGLRQFDEGFAVEGGDLERAREVLASWT
jgi:hypothetical protein